MRRSRALALAAAGATAAALPRRAWAQTAPIRVGTSPAATQAEAYYADQLGFFKAAGLTVTQTIVTRGIDSLAGVVASTLDVGMTTPQALANAIIHEIPIQVIATGAVYADPPPFQLYVEKDAPQRDARSLERATIAVQTLGDSQTLGIWAWMAQNRVDTTEVKFIEMPFGTMAAALKRGEVTAAFIAEPFASAGKDDIRPIPHVYDSLGRRFALGSYFARRDWIEKNPALVKSFVGAIYATGRKVNADQSAIDPYLATYSKIPLETIRTIVKPVWAALSERSNLEPQLQAAAKFNLISRPVSYHEMTGS